MLSADEIDAIGTKRYDSHSGGEREIQRTMLELLNQMDGFDALSEVKVRGASDMFCKVVRVMIDWQLHVLVLVRRHLVCRAHVVLGNLAVSGMVAVRCPCSCSAACVKLCTPIPQQEG